MRILTMAMFVAACGPAGSQPDQPGHPDGPTSDAPSQGSSSGSDSGTGSGSDPLSDYRSGTRIKMQVLTTPDGAKQFNGWFDTARNEPCNFAQASDGVLRCLPTLAQSSLFLDSSCTMPAAEALPGCVNYVTAPQSLTTTCPVTVKFGAIFPATVVNPTPAVFVKNTVSCVASTVPSGLVVLVAAGPEIPPTAFQSATLNVE